MEFKATILVVLVVIVSLGLVIAACAGSQLAPGIAVEDLVGVWQEETIVAATEYIQLNEDGTYSVANEQHWLEEAPVEIGEFRLEGTLLTFITGSESKACVGQNGSYQVELTEQGQLEFVLEEDECEIRAIGQPGLYSRVEP